MFSSVITRLNVINIAPLRELFCNCPLADLKLLAVCNCVCLCVCVCVCVWGGGGGGAGG